MKRILTAGVLSVAVALGCAAQAIVRMPVEQNPLFEVSTSKVEIAMPEEGGGVLLGGNVVVTGGSGVYTYRWYTPQGKELGTESTCMAETPGVYMLDITDGCDCLQTVEFNLTSASIDGAEIATLHIGPNPTSGVVYIEGFNAVRIAAVDMAGRLVSVVESIGGQHITDADYSALPQGEYILTLASADGAKAVYRLIKR
ncbi:MAG: T9SS type A sorting domain-containing protein [Muribaculaceae bacterium]|jgi:hypothetical protein